MRLANSLALAGFVLAAFIKTTVLEAATITYNLTDGSTLPCDISGNITIDSCQTLGLIDTDTGQPFLSGFTLNVGDRIDGSVTLSTPLTVPLESNVTLVDLFLSGGSPTTTINYTDAVSLYYHGVQVLPQAQWTNITSTPGVLLFGGDTTASPTFLFDKLVFDSTVTSMYDQNNNPINSLNLALFSSPALTAATFTPAPVPLPATIWLVLSGIGGLGVMLCKVTNRRSNVLGEQQAAG